LSLIFFFVIGWILLQSVQLQEGIEQAKVNEE